MVFWRCDNCGDLCTSIYTVFHSLSFNNTMASGKGPKTAVYMANCFKAKDNEYSDEQTGEIETSEFADFEPFMASFCRYRLDMPETETEALMKNGLNKIRANGHKRQIIEIFFDYNM